MSSKFVLQQEDGTIANGDARGAYAVDLQMQRDNADQVATSNNVAILSGAYNKINTNGIATGNVIVGGQRNNISGTNKTSVFIGAGSSNTIDGGASVIVGGNLNTSFANSTFIGGGDSNTANGTLSVLVGGSNNQSNANYTTVGGGQSNVASGSHATISGGQSNTASTNTHATVVGGSTNTASGQYSVAGGGNNVASAQSSTAFGRYTQASGNNSFAAGNSSIAVGENSACFGFAGLSSGYASAAIGDRGFSYLYGQFSVASGRFGLGFGDATQSLLTARKEDTLSSAATTVLSLDGTGTTNLIIPYHGNSAWNVTVKWVAVCTATGSGTTAVGDVAIATDSFMFKRVSGTSSIGSVQNLQNSQDATMAGATCSYAVGGSQDLQITFTAPASANATTFRVVAKVELTEVAW